MGWAAGGGGGVPALIVFHRILCIFLLDKKKENFNDNCDFDFKSNIPVKNCW